jgi:hypothetical protein
MRGRVGVLVGTYRVRLKVVLNAHLSAVSLYTSLLLFISSSQGL